jgi:hypothetical protein
MNKKLASRCAASSIPVLLKPKLQLYNVLKPILILPTTIVNKILEKIKQ